MNNINKLQAYLFSLDNDLRIPLVIELCEQVKVVKINGIYYECGVTTKNNDRLQQLWDEIWKELSKV